MVVSGASEASYDFSKYTRAGPVSRFLVDRFFSGVHALLRQASPQSVLEVGCGAGFSTKRIREMLGPKIRLEASDVEEGMVEAARANNPDLEVTRESVYELHREDDSVDLVLCLEVLEHLERPEDALRELRRVAREWLIVTVPREPLWRLLNMARLRYVADCGNTPGHIQHWSKAGFVRFMERMVEPTAVRAPIPWTQVLARV
jgi:ubiquinone/menaquinone biosynthesis C-methylase UbiE